MCRFAQKIQETEAIELKPVFEEDGISFAYIQHNNLYILAVTRKNSNVAAILVFLERIVEVSDNYRTCISPGRRSAHSARWFNRFYANTLEVLKRNPSATIL